MTTFGDTKIKFLFARQPLIRKLISWNFFVVETIKRLRMKFILATPYPSLSQIHFYLNHGKTIEWQSQEGHPIGFDVNQKKVTSILTYVLLLSVVCDFIYDRMTNRFIQEQRQHILKIDQIILLKQTI